MSARNHIWIAGFIFLVFLLMTGPARLADAQHAGHEAAPASPQPQQAEVPVVEIPIDKQQMIGVRTVSVSRKPLKISVRTVGRVEFDEKKIATVNARFEGWIEKLYADYVGKKVKKGEPLAEVYSPELYATQQEIINMMKWTGKGTAVKDDAINAMLAKDAETMTDAAMQRLKLWDISEQQIAAIIESGKPRRTLMITSPVDGTIVQKSAISGMRFMPGEKLFDIVDLSSVWIIAEVYENELPLIRVGDAAAIRLSSMPGKLLNARIEYIAPTLSAESRTAKVRLSLPNAGGMIKPQMFTNVEIEVDAGTRLAVPEDAVIDTGERQLVYVDKGEGNFEPREVKLGLRADGYREVLKGLQSGENVARSATFLIDSEAQLKGIVK